ncbi:MAG: hypothetical protein MRJ92_05855 [Nitrospira sp.]|nr:hypothetical protein [Nitrospira sp.]
MPNIHSMLNNEERREWLRIEDRLLLEYRRVDESADAMNAYLPPATETRSHGGPSRRSTC